MKNKYLRETRMVDFSNPAIQKLIQNMKCANCNNKLNIES